MLLLTRLALAIAMIALASVALTPSAFADYVQVTRNAHVRQSATKESTSLKVATIGQQFPLLDDGARRRGFYHIDLGDSRTGWIYGNLVDRHAGELNSAVALGANRVAVHFIDVEQGAAALVEFPCAAVLIDAGGRTETSDDHLMNYLAAFFARRADLHNRIETVFITHTHLDHNRALRRVAETYEIGGYVHNGVLTGSGRVAANWMINHQNQSGVHLRMRAVPDTDVTAQGTRGLTDGVIDAVACPSTDPSIKILSGRQDDNPGWPDGDFENGNNLGIVIRIDYGQASFLFSGDLEEPAIETLVDYYAQTQALNVDVWAVGHHGSANGVTPSLINAMTPKIAVMSMGSPASHDLWTAYAYGHPRRSAVELIDRLLTGARQGPATKQVADKTKTFSTYRINHALYATGWDGDVTISADSGGAFNVALGQ